MSRIAFLTASLTIAILNTSAQAQYYQQPQYSPHPQAYQGQHYHAQPQQPYYVPQIRHPVQRQQVQPHYGYAYQPTPQAYYHAPQPQYAPQSVYRQAPQYYHHAPQHHYGNSQSYGHAAVQPVSACSRIENPVSRQACDCAVQFGGVASGAGNNVVWHDPKGGGGMSGLLACKSAGNSLGSRQSAFERDAPGGVR